MTLMSRAASVSRVIYLTCMSWKCMCGNWGMGVIWVTWVIRECICAQVIPIIQFTQVTQVIQVPEHTGQLGH